jgi:L-carnitine CoA-transferase
VYRCKDGNYIFMALVGYGVLKSGLPLFGCEFGSDDFPATLSHVPQGSPGARKLEPRIQEFFASRTVAEAEVDLLKAGIPCSPVMDYAMMVDHPHYQARGVFTEWDNPVGLRFRGVSVLPKLQKHPGRIWRGYPTLGMDNEDILAELGYSPADIAALYERKALGKKDDL